MKLEVLFPGRMDYEEALNIQYDLVKKRQEQTIGDTLLLLEHPPVITKGKRAGAGDILVSKGFLEKNKVQVFEINRGGEATYHGPGQIVGYIIINLHNRQRNIKEFVYNIEEVFIRLLKDKYGITAERDLLHRGVWIKGKKIAAIGIAVKKGVTMHGFAFNINTELDHFKWIVPCGITQGEVTSIKELTEKPQNLQEVNRFVAEYFCDVFGYDKYED